MWQDFKTEVGLSECPQQVIPVGGPLSEFVEGLETKTKLSLRLEHRQPGVQALFSESTSPTFNSLGNKIPWETEASGRHVETKCHNDSKKV